MAAARPSAPCTPAAAAASNMPAMWAIFLAIFTVGSPSSPWLRYGVVAPHRAFFERPCVRDRERTGTRYLICEDWGQDFS